ncbi:MAG TPA: DNA polymerase, partial [Candidatus Paceibacterota bacterium]
VFTLRKGLTDTVIYDEQAVHDRFGFGPEHIVDYKALRGDPSDNIPGVRGIGEKTATELIKHFGTIRSLYDALAKDPKIVEKKGVKPRIVQLLLEQKAEAAFSRELAEIEQNAPLAFALPKTHWHLKEHDGSIAHLLDELEFRSLRARLGFPAQAADAGGAEIAGIAVDQKSLEETSVALWLLRSDMTTPTLADILHFGNTQDFGRARERIFEELRATGRLIGVYEEIERPLIPVVQRMNATGIRLDTNYLGKLSKEYGAELQAVAGRIYKHAGHEFNINSPKQLEVVLYDELKISLPRQKKTATGARTTREEELAKMMGLHPVIADVLAYRELQKLLGTYIEKMPKLIGEDGRLHTKFEQSGTTTGRMSCRDPNLQNIPIKSENGRRIRGAFTADKGCTLVAIDYSQIELRVAAGLSGDKKLISIFREGGDVHTAVASQVFAVPPEHVDYEMRRRAKVINFGILYGMGVNALRANLGPDVGRDEAALFLSEYFKNFSGLAHFIEKTKADAARLGYTETLYGRRRYFPAFKSALPNLRAQAERMAINAPIQGTQADIIKRAMFEADTLIEKEGWRSEVRLLLQVHDELVYEIASDKAESIARRLRDVMEGIVETKLLSGVPIIAEIAIGPNWGAVERIAR